MSKLNIMIAPYKITDDQHIWLKKQRDRTGESFASILRKLLQDKVEEEKK